MQSRFDAPPAGVSDDGVALSPLLNRALKALGYLAVAGYLCWRLTRINSVAPDRIALPAFLCMTTAMLLIVLAVLTLVRRPAGRDEGPS